MSFLASSSRLPSSSLSPSLTFIRTKKTDGSARYAKNKTPLQLVQKPRDIHDPRTPLSSSGAQEPHPPYLTEHVPVKSSVALDDTYLRLHHSPPASAPSYTIGGVPPLLKWLGGESVQLSGEEAAPYISKEEESRMKQSPVMPLGNGREWSDEIRGEITRMRRNGVSISNVAKRLGIPEHQHKLVPFVATASSERLAKEEKKLEKVKSTWGVNKRLERAVRERRKAFW